ncbi:MAG: ISNCY family transposase [Acidimicrobiia bacterium]|nr:ISNCY family transposase [Acidimicrobiia bacterium]
MTPGTVDGPECRHRSYADHNNFRTITTLDGVIRLTSTIRRCPNPACSRFLRPYRPEAEPHFAWPYHELGLDIRALVGRPRDAEHRSIPEIHRELTRRGIIGARRTVTNLRDRSDELRALATADPDRLGPRLREQGRVLLAIDGLQPDVGPEVLWVVRDCLSGEILLAQGLLSSTARDRAGLIDPVRKAPPVPITGVVSDGQEGLRKAVAQALKGVPHQLGHFHSLREAARPISEAERQARDELKERVRGIRPIARAAEEKAEDGEDDAEAEVVRGSCAAVRAAWTDDGRPPLAASGLERPDRLSRIAARRDQVAARAGDVPGGWGRLRRSLRRGLEETAALFPAVRESYRWVKRAARILTNAAAWPAKEVRRRLVQLLVRLRRAAAPTDEPSVRAGLKPFLKVTRSSWPGLFHGSASADLPRTTHDLEHAVGSHRSHERRASGRRRAAPGLVVMGSARVISGLATRLRPDEGLVLGPGSVADWKELRAELEARRESRRKQRRFRHDPDAYLKDLEHRCLQLTLPP